MHKMTVSVLVGAALFVVACASNPFQKFYTPSQVRGTLAPRAASANEQVHILRGNNLEQDGIAMLQNGFFYLGSSSFNGRAFSPDLAIEQAKNVGASTVVVYSRYLSTVTGNIPLVLPAPPTTATTSTQGTIYGSGGTATFSGTSNTTFSGGTTTYNIPYQVDRYDQAATYWAKGRTPVCGVYVRDLNDGERRHLQRNRGAVVIAVLKNSPAFLADILRGDVIVRVAGNEIAGSQDLLDLLAQYAGKEVLIEIERDSGPKDITLKLNPKEP